MPAATGYRLELRSPPGGSPTTLDASGLAADLGGLVPGQPYAISVAALAGGAEGARSAAVPFSPPAPPAPPTALAVGERYDAAAVLDAVLLTWAPSADLVDGYRIYRSTDGGTTWAERGPAADAVHVDPLGADEVCQRLRYRVASYRGDASSARSAGKAARGTVLASSSTTDPFDTVTSRARPADGGRRRGPTA